MGRGRGEGKGKGDGVLEGGKGSERKTEDWGVGGGRRGWGEEKWEE